jgi:hypothetical protein
LSREEMPQKKPRHEPRKKSDSDPDDSASDSSRLSIDGQPKGTAGADPQELLRNQSDLKREKKNQEANGKIMNHPALKKEAIRQQELLGNLHMQRMLLSVSFNNLRSSRDKCPPSIRRRIALTLNGMRITLASMKESEEEIEGVLLVLGSADIFQGSLANDFIDLVEASRITIGGKKTYPEAVKMAQKSFKNVKDLAAMAIASYDRGHGGRDGGGNKGGNGKGGKGN